MFADHALQYRASARNTLQQRIFQYVGDWDRFFLRSVPSLPSHEEPEGAFDPVI